MRASVVAHTRAVAGAADRTTRRLLRCGVLAGPLFVGVTAVDALVRQGFDIRRHGISLLSLGPSGWIQVTNFVVAGALSIAFADGVRRTLHDQLGGTAAPLLIGGYGLGLVSTGLFLVDPGLGFPPGAPTELPTQLSWHGAMHAAAPPVAFACVVGLAAVFARRYARQGRLGWAAWSAATAVTTAALAAWPVGGGSVRSALAVLVTSVWMTAVAADVLRSVRTTTPAAGR